MSQTPSQLRASKKYHEDKLEEIKFRAPKGQKSRILEYTQNMGESINAFVYRAVNETIERDKETHSSEE